MTNDARSKLRSMGGIMASSPELMQVAQKFQAGGPVAPQPPMAGRLPFMPRPIRGPMSLNRSLNDPGPTPIIEPPLAGTIPVVPREMVGDPRRRALAGTAPSFGMGVGLGSLDPILEDDVDIDTLLGASRSRGASVEKPIATMAEDPEDTDFTTLPEVKVGSVPYRVDVAAGRVFRNDGTPVSGREAEMALRVAPEATYTAERASASSRERKESKDISNKQKRLESLRDTYIQGVPPSSAVKDEVAQLESEIGAAREGLGKELSAEDTAMAQPLVPKKLDQSVIDKMLDLAKKDPNVPFGTETPTPDGDQTPTPDGDQALTGDGDTPTGDRTTAPAKETKRDLRSRYNEQLELYKEIYGLEDKDEARDRAMSLAMIGLAIAAGQSPNALTNIAQGAMVGLQGMGAQREAERERERGLKTLALQTAIDQQQAETEAEAEAAKMDLEQRNRLAVARIRAAGGTGSSYTPERLRQQAIDKILADPYAYPSLMDEETQTIDPDKLKIYVDRIVAVESPTAPTAPELDELTDEERALLGG